MQSGTLVGLVCGLAALGLVVPAAYAGDAPDPPGERLEHRGDHMESIAEAREACAEGAGVDGRLTYAQLLYEAGDFERARDEVTPLLHEPEPAVNAVMLAARVAYLTGDYTRAERLFEDALSRDPENARAATGLVLIYYQTNRYERCAGLPQELRQKIRLPLMDMMIAFEGERPYGMKWSGEPRTDVPFLAADPLPVVSVEVEGHRINAIIDTGGDTFILDTEVADSLGVEIIASMMGMFAGGKQAEVGFARADSLALGGVTLHSVPIAVLPTKQFRMGDREIGGIVGTGVLRQFLATLDYPNERLVLRDPTAESGAALRRDLGARLLQEIPFYLQSTHFLMAKGSLNGRDGLLFHVDSGLAGEPAFSATRQTLEYVGIRVPEAVVRDDVVGGGGGGLAVGTFAIDQLGLGRLIQSDLIGSYGAMPPESYRRLGFIQDGLVSHNFLREYALTIDFSTVTMVFAR